MPAESYSPAVTVGHPLRSRHRIPLNFSLYVSIQIASFAPGKTDNRCGDPQLAQFARSALLLGPEATYKSAELSRDRPAVPCKRLLV